MTEAEWLHCEETWRMMVFLRGARLVSGRKCRLFGCACVRRAWHLLDDERSRAAVVLAEQLADGSVSRKHLAEGGAREAAGRVRGGLPGRAAGAARKLLLRSSRMAGNDASRSASLALGGDALQPALLRDLVGNPFRPAALDPAVRTPVVAGLARAAYDERLLPSGELDRTRLAVLADALEEAGCEGADLLDHLRGPGPHVRGCWALDLVLGLA
jgi:hypothetical protein